VILFKTRRTADQQMRHHDRQSSAMQKHIKKRKETIEIYAPSRAPTSASRDQWEATEISAFSRCRSRKYEEIRSGGGEPGRPQRPRQTRGRRD